MSIELGPVYHWSPRSRRKSIDRYGLMPGKKTIRQHDPDGEFYQAMEEWRSPYICFGTTPATAWNYALIRESDTYDLWEVYLERDDEVIVQPMWGPRVIEVRVHNRVKKSRLIWVGERVFEAKRPAS